MKTILTTLLVLAIGVVYSQDLKGIILNIDNRPIEGARIVSEQGTLIARSDSLGHFVINVKRYPVFGVEMHGYSARWYKMGEKPKSEMVIILDYYYQELDAVTVEKRKEEEALDINAVNIIDYHPFGSKILTLKRDKKDYFIGVDSLKTEGPQFLFKKERPRKFFLDCMGNMHLICVENIYQFVIVKDSLMIIDKISRAKFDALIAPCVAKSGDKVVMKELTQHNQVYDLYLYEKGKPDMRFYHAEDEVSKRVAAEEALKLEFKVREEFLGDSLQAHIPSIRRYLRQVHNGENPDVNLDFIIESLTGPSNPLDKGLRWSDAMAMYKVHSYPINIRSFHVNDYVIIVNFEENQVLIYSLDGELMKSSSFSAPGDVKEVWKDNLSGKIYLYSMEKGTHGIYHIDPNSGAMLFLQDMQEFKFTESHKIYNGWLYYREINNGFFQINRLRLPNH